MRTKPQRLTFRIPKRRVRSRIQKEASPRHCCAERSNPGARSSIWIATARSVPRDDGVPGAPGAVRATARRLKGETLEILPGKPQSDAVAPALETEEAPGTPEPLVQISCRLLHVQTGILILLSVYTFYASSPVLIPVTLAVLITMFSRGCRLAGRAEEIPASSAAAAIAILSESLAAALTVCRVPLRNGCTSCPKLAAKSMKCCAPSKSPSLKSEQAAERLSAPTDRQTQRARKVQ